MRVEAIRVLLAVMVALLAGGAAADAEKGMAALEKGDYKTALKELNADAKKGDADAMFMLSRLYAEGKGVKEDRKQAFQWMERAAKTGSVRAQGTLAMYFSEGIGVAKDDAKSLELGRRAAQGGDLISQFIMGMRYNNGVGVLRDIEQAAAWWGKAAERGMLRAQVMLAGLLAQKAALPDAAPEQASADRVEAAKWLIVSESARLPGTESTLTSIKEKMTAEEIGVAEERAHGWRPTGAGK